MLDASPRLPDEPAPTLTGLDKILAQVSGLSHLPRTDCASQARTAYVADDRPISPVSADSAQAAFMAALGQLSFGAPSWLKWRCDRDIAM